MMRLRLRAIFLLMVIFWQSLSALAPLTVAARATEMAHLTVHSQDTSHHHHADQALHMDDDDSAVQHLHVDSGTGTTGLLTSLLLAVARIRSMSPPETSHSIWRSPTLEGPLRPPMLNA